ncbi:MAG: hypothetical protein QNJ05_05160 [Woeseiaceae bacterium]|nr:hypothetical protein [Woeseiaceae bacterium]
MSVHLIKTAWGLVGTGNRYATLFDFVESARDEQYVGVEFPVFYMDLEDGGAAGVAGPLREHIESLGLDYIALIATRTEHWGDHDAHLASFREQCELAASMGAQRAAVHAGADSFDENRARLFLEDCRRIALDLGVQPCFETHRGRILFNPFICARMLEQIPDLELTSDLSHWLLVVDRIPNDIMGLFDHASERSRHLHARIGHEKSPQVTEPADPFWEQHVSLYRRWWQISVDAAQAAGSVLSISPEFGPPPYMHAEPFTQKPSGDIVAANNWMRDQLRDWFKEETTT